MTPKVEGEKKCIVCNKMFVSKQHNKVCCGEKCKTINHFNTYSKIKKCEYCKKEFKTINKKTCSKECRHKLSGISNRGKKWAMSIEGRKKISLGRKKYLSDPDNLKKHALNTKKSWLNKNTRKKRTTKERAKKISRTTIEIYRNGTRKLNTIKNKKLYYKNIFMRSTWEIRVAKWLDEKKVKWEYESHSCRFKLSSGRTYIVDFYLPEFNKYIEVKGWWDKNSFYKCKDFINSKGMNKLIIIDGNNINNIDLNLYFFELLPEFNLFVDAQIENIKGVNI